MKIIKGTSNVPTTIVIFIFILFVTLGILLTLPLPQFIYAQTVENELIENTLEKVKEATQEISETTNSLNDTPKATGSNTTTTTFDESNLNHNQRSEYKIYESDAIGVKFKIPSTWEIREYNSTKGCFEGETDSIFITTFNCSIRLDYNKVSYPHDFEIIISKDSTSNHSLTDYLSFAYERTKQNAIKNQADVSFISDKEITIQNNLPAWQIEYSINSGISQYKQMDIVTKVNNTFYGLVYLQTNPSDYSKYLPEFENFVKSIEFIPSIEPKPSFLKFSSPENAINNGTTKQIQIQGNNGLNMEQVKEESDYYSTAQTTTITNNITDLLFEKYYPIVKVDYESDTMIVLEGNKNYLSEINGSLAPFWEAIDVVKNQGYSLNEITTSGTGSKDNPAIIYAIFFNNSRIEK